MKNIPVAYPNVNGDIGIGHVNKENKLLKVA